MISTLAKYVAIVNASNADHADCVGGLIVDKKMYVVWTDADTDETPFYVLFETKEEAEKFLDDPTQHNFKDKHNQTWFAHMKWQDSGEYEFGTLL